MRKLNRLIIGIWLTAFNAEADYRDPTQPGNLPASQAATTTTQQNPDTAINLTAILISDSSRHAIINGITVKAGQQLNIDTRILTIQPHYILIRHRGSTQKLYLVPSLKPH